MFIKWVFSHPLLTRPSWYDSMRQTGHINGDRDEEVENQINSGGSVDGGPQGENNQGEAVVAELTTQVSRNDNSEDENVHQATTESYTPLVIGMDGCRPAPKPSRFFKKIQRCLLGNRRQT